jgi:signal transduction histidine kinase
MAATVLIVDDHAGFRLSARRILTVDVSDDGVGGADRGSGSGLRGLADRLATLEGTLAVVSPLGEGTIVKAVIPCG